MDFKNHNDYDIFQRDIRYKQRYVHTGPVVEFLKALKTTLPERTRSLSKGNLLCRAQIGFAEENLDGESIIRGFSEQRMKPNRDYCGEGRANPRGIPYLYLSNDLDTCMAELRPQRAEMLSVAQFEIQRNLKIVDCFSTKQEFWNVELIFNPPTTQEGIRNAIWWQINQAFSRPVSRGDTSSSYIPTQVLVEFFLDNGLDGVCFKSGLGKGLNFVLFDLAAADLINCGVYSVDSVNYEFSECANRYFRKSN
ncbi:RES family NAD+ phosphorylase [Janthinobacterium sp. 64]|uniref:RES family NAD+ phosphorylase n=1 Tax=Janthinobacterium sp. 64 TaxID=2035208 RepID=UPI000CBD8EA9|nr:RES family NAD+ phosphorylase [Janthinobacterium sp. 64]PKB19732.1 RES domain-containing protein [Janthinobacterium sp. 64]